MSDLGKEKKTTPPLVSGICVARIEKQHLQVCRLKIHTGEADT